MTESEEKSQQGDTDGEKVNIQGFKHFPTLGKQKKTKKAFGFKYILMLNARQAAIYTVEIHIFFLNAKGLKVL